MQDNLSHIVHAGNCKISIGRIGLTLMNAWDKEKYHAIACYDFDLDMHDGTGKPLSVSHTEICSYNSN